MGNSCCKTPIKEYQLSNIPEIPLSGDDMLKNARKHILKIIRIQSHFRMFRSQRAIKSMLLDKLK